MKKTAGFIVIGMMITSAVCVWAEGLDSLIEVGKSMADINAAMDEETRTFSDVKTDVDRGAIRKGASKDSIRSRYGEPVIINDDASTKREKWVYKPATSTFFEGIKIYLYFDSNGALDEIRIAK